LELAGQNPGVLRPHAEGDERARVAEHRVAHLRLWLVQVLVGQVEAHTIFPQFGRHVHERERREGLELISTQEEWPAALRWAKRAEALLEEKGRELYLAKVAAERANRENSDAELRYRGLFETAKDSILLLDLQTGHVTDINSALITMLGLAPSRILGRMLWQLEPFKNNADCRTMLHDLESQGQPRPKNAPLPARRQPGRRDRLERGDAARHRQPPPLAKT